jgi:hypothetical protein
MLQRRREKKASGNSSRQRPKYEIVDDSGAATEGVIVAKVSKGESLSKNSVRPPVAQVGTVHVIEEPGAENPLDTSVKHEEVVVSVDGVTHPNRAPSPEGLNCPGQSTKRPKSVLPGVKGRVKSTTVPAERAGTSTSRSKMPPVAPEGEPLERPQVAVELGSVLSPPHTMICWNPFESGVLCKLTMIDPDPSKLGSPYAPADRVAMVPAEATVTAKRTPTKRQNGFATDRMVIPRKKTSCMDGAISVPVRNSDDSSSHESKCFVLFVFRDPRARIPVKRTVPNCLLCEVSCTHVTSSGVDLLMCQFLAGMPGIGSDPQESSGRCISLKRL